MCFQRSNAICFGKFDEPFFMMELGWTRMLPTIIETSK
jgi:hypothetical protein